MFGEPAADGTPDEQPGAMPEIVPSPDFGKNISNCWICRSMFLHASGSYGTAWPVIHQQLGVRPDLGRGELSVVPQLPSASPIAGQDIRFGTGKLGLVAASRDGRRYRTTVNAAEAPIRRLWIGHTIPTGSQVHSVTLDGRQVGWNARATNRGVEVTTPVEPGEHTLGVEVG